MSRRYSVGHRDAKGTVWSATFDKPEDALECFVQGLKVDGHSQEVITQVMGEFDKVSLSKLTPDLTGTTYIRVHE